MLVLIIALLRALRCAPSARLTIPLLHMLFQSNQGDGLNEDAEPDAKAAKSPLQRTLTAQILVHWAEHMKASSDIGLKRSVEAVRSAFSCRLTPRTQSVFAELFPDAGQTPLSQSCHRRKKRLSCSTITHSLVFLTVQCISLLPAFQRQCGRLFSAGAMERLFPRC